MGIGGDNVAHTEVASRSVPRQPNKPKKGEPFRTHIVLPGDLVILIDKFAEQPVDAFGKKRTRTDATIQLIADGLKKNGLLK